MKNFVANLDFIVRSLHEAMDEGATISKEGDANAGDIVAVESESGTKWRETEEAGKGGEGRGECEDEGRRDGERRERSRGSRATDE
jgi:hypothetical protein